MSVHWAPIHVTSMLIVITLWGTITVLVTLNTLEMVPRAQVISCMTHFLNILSMSLVCFSNSTNLSLLVLSFCSSLRLFVWICICLPIRQTGRTLAMSVIRCHHVWYTLRTSVIWNNIWSGLHYTIQRGKMLMLSLNVKYLFVDFDECAANTDNCDDNAYCNNTVGSFNCTCNSGYTGNGTTCLGKCGYFVLDNGFFYTHIQYSKQRTNYFRFNRNYQLNGEKRRTFSHDSFGNNFIISESIWYRRKSQTKYKRIL